MKQGVITTNVCGLLVAVVCLVSPSAAKAIEVIKVSGVVEAARYAPRAGKPFTNTILHASFTVQISTEALRISITNSRDSRFWTEYCYDGTNSYVMSGRDGNPWFDTNPQSNQVFVTISPTPYYTANQDDTLGLAVLWQMYGLSPTRIKPGKSGKVDFPLPWKVGRTVASVVAYGYRWEITPGPGGRFAESCSAIRDGSLDLDDKAELLRWDSDFPETLESYKELLEALESRRRIPGGFVASNYRCTRWSETNGLAIPMESDFEWFFPEVTTFPGYKAKVIADKLEIAITLSLPILQSPALVYDYRFKQAGNHRIFKYAEYTNAPGQIWPSDDDPELKAKAKAHLKNGRRYDDFGLLARIFGAQSKIKLFIVWALMGLTVVPFALMLWKKSNKKNQQQQ